MVLINGQNFQTYDLDSVQSIINRLASQYNTLPKYIYFPNGVPDINTFLTSPENIIVEDLLQTIKNYGTNDYEFKNIYENIKSKLSQNNLEIKDILEPFIVFNQKIKTIPEDFRSMLAYTMIETVPELKIDKKLLEQLLQEKNEYERSFTSRINNNKKEATKDVKLFNQLSTILEGIPSTNFELEKITLKLTLKLKGDMSLNEIFNSIILNEYVPFASINNKYYKILKEFTPYANWSKSKFEGITFKILEKKTYNPKEEDFTNIILNYEEIDDTQVITAILKLGTTTFNYPLNDSINRFLQTISSVEPVIESTKEIQVNGVFYFPKQELDVYVFSDLVLNNPLFSSLLVINESKKVNNEKDSTYVYFNLPRIGKVTANLTEKIMNKNDPLMKNKNKNLFPINEKYVRVKVTRANNTVSVNEYKNILSKLFVIYNNEYLPIVTFYKKYIPNFGVRVAVEPVTSKLNLKDIAPDLFLPLYSRKCTNRPTIISDEEKIEAEAKGQQVMVFPKSGTEDVISRNYICNHPEHIYPGIRKNPFFENKDKYPYLPCCYKKNQQDIQGSTYREYFYGESVPDKDMKQQDFITTGKFVTHDQFGTLPSNIQKLFDISEPNKKYKYIRKGVFRTKSSFLECVIEAMDIEKIIDLDTVEEREIYLANKRKELATPEYAASCRQELYNFSEQEIINAIKNPNLYMDPKSFIHLLEIAYKCNIFIFTRKSIGGEITLPNHLEAYFKNKSSKQCVFIFEHNGSESDNAQYPQCELIIRYNSESKSEEPTYSFPFIEPISKGVNYVFNQLKKAYIGGTEIKDANFTFTIAPQYQVIDKYGKARIFKFIYNNQTIDIITTPLQPLPIIETKNNNINNINIEIALQFCYFMKINIEGQTIFNGNIKNIFGKIGNVDITIPVNNSPPIADIPIVNKNITYPESNVSDLQTYNNNKKIARYITEYLFWMYSIFINVNNIIILDINSIKSFIDNKVIIIPDYTYNNIGNIFTLSSNMIQDGKLVVTSEEMLKRLIFVLRLEIIRNKPELLNYYKKSSIPNYYVDITDFDTYPHQIILLGDTSVEKVIQENKVNYNLQYKVDINSIYPYFFRNKLIDSNIYIAQNTDNINNALQIERIWREKGYNIGSDVENSSDREPFVFTLYSYTNSENINKKYINGIDPDYKILGYKTENKSLFTALLPM
jgi:hypothetical protein